MWGAISLLVFNKSPSNLATLLISKGSFCQCWLIFTNLSQSNVEETAEGSTPSSSSPNPKNQLVCYHNHTLMAIMTRHLTSSLLQNPLFQGLYECSTAVHVIINQVMLLNLNMLFNNYSSSPNGLWVNSYWLRGHEGERNNCFSKIQLVVQKYRDKTTLAS